jgi:hypothetical protein
MTKNIDNQATDGEEKSKPEVIKLGLDLHARQVTECRQLDGSTPKPAQQSARTDNIRGFRTELSENKASLKTTLRENETTLSENRPRISALDHINENG